MSNIYVTNAGSGYTSTPTITLSHPGVGTGNYLYNEVITGETSGTQAIVKNWDAKDTVKTLGNLFEAF